MFIKCVKLSMTSRQFIWKCFKSQSKAEKSHIMWPGEDNILLFVFLLDVQYLIAKHKFN